MVGQKSKILVAQTYEELEEAINEFMRQHKTILSVSYSDGPTRVSALIIYGVYEYTELMDLD